jgi:hypothetical protein
MKLCHSLDMRYDRIGSGLILQATCCAPKCGRMYARLVNSKVKTWVAGKHFANADDWATLLTMRKLFDEMRCVSTGFCESCEAGHSLNECRGLVKAHG